MKKKKKTREGRRKNWMDFLASYCNNKIDMEKKKNPKRKLYTLNEYNNFNSNYHFHTQSLPPCLPFETDISFV